MKKNDDYLMKAASSLLVMMMFCVAIFISNFSPYVVDSIVWIMTLLIATDVGVTYGKTHYEPDETKFAKTTSIVILIACLIFAVCTALAFINEMSKALVLIMGIVSISTALGGGTLLGISRIKKS